MPTVSLHAEDCAFEQLLEAAQKGNETAIEHLLSPYTQPLYALCCGILLHPENAEDAVQETFLRALRGLPAFRGEAGIKTWLTRIAVNVCLEQKRRARADEPLAERHDRIGSAARALEENVLARLYLEDALQALRPRQRVVLLLKESEGWTAAEIAAALEWAVPRVNMELYRTRRAIARWLRKQEEEESR